MLDVDVAAARERILDQVFDARSPHEIEAARNALKCWIDSHPNEPGMADALEVLSHRDDFASELDARPYELKTATG